MWHTTEIADIIAKITNDYGYGVFKNRKQCVALCGDLFARYEREKQIFQMLFQAGLGEVINDAPFRTGIKNRAISCGYFFAKTGD